MKSLEIRHTRVFERNFEAFNDTNIRFLINQGGSRSSKTFSLCQMIIVYCLTNPKKVVSIVRMSFPSLRGSVMRDFFEVMEELGLYEVSNHNKTENIYKFTNGSMVEFFSVDNEQKLRGRKRDILWANEANELDFGQFTQLNMRTSEKLIFDFNPSDNYHWIYDLVDRDNSVLIHSTYKDNPFLSESQIKEMDNLINVDEAYYRIYALGERTITKTTIYTNWKVTKNPPEFKEVVWGLDFGFTSPSALVKCEFNDMGECHVKESIYEGNLTSTDLIKRMKELQINRSSEIICDSARPEIIEDLRRAGFNAKSANKSIMDGINSVRMWKLLINEESVNIIKEIQNYKFKSSGDIVYDDPIKIHDHAMDAMRYAIHHWKLQNSKTDMKYYRIRY
jgi:phage terminase large subunit